LAGSFKSLRAVAELLVCCAVETSMPLPSGPPLRGFRAVCTAVAVLYVFLGASMKLRGPRGALAQFGVPPEVLDARHFADFFQFLFLHMMVIGLLVGLLGWAVTEPARQRTVARLLCGLEIVYAWFDFRTSDSMLGNGLYQGPASLVPPVLDLLVAAAFAALGSRRLRSSP
jgi:hypothetical protein